MSEKLETYSCSVCDKRLVEMTNDDLDFPEFEAETFFEIKRSRYGFDIEDGAIIREEENEKMNRFLCEDCFNKICNESPTMNKMFMTRIEGKLERIY